jgi:hypothetical protein
MPDKFIREIEEILEKAEKDRPRASSKQAKRPKTQDAQSNQPSRISRFRPSFHISAGKVFVSVISLLLVFILVSPFVLVSGTVTLLMGICVVFLILTYLLFFMPSSTFGYEKRWRGKPLEEKQSIREKLRRWLRGR